MNKAQLAKVLAEESDGRWSSQRPLLLAAARLVERLLPRECENCGGSGEWMVGTGPLSGLLAPCPVCHGSGRVWDEGIVEAVAKALFAVEFSSKDFTALRPVGGIADTYREYARAGLSALVELLTEKAGSQ